MCILYSLGLEIASLFSEKFDAGFRGILKASALPLFHDVSDGDPIVHTTEGGACAIAFHDTDHAFVLTACSFTPRGILGADV